MKNDRKKHPDKPGRVLFRWAAALSLGLISVQASAFKGHHLQATDSIAAAQELAAEIGCTTQAPCQLTALDWEDAATPSDMERFFRLQCQNERFLLKYGTPSSMAFDQLTEQEAVEQPVAEFSFDEAGKGQRVYKVYLSGTESISLRDWLRQVTRQPESGAWKLSQAKRLRNVLHQAGSLIGASTRAGLAQESTQKTAGGFNARNLRVTPKDEVLAYLDTPVAVSESEVREAILPPQLEMFDTELSSLPIMAIKDFKVAFDVSMTGLTTAYCEALEGTGPAQGVAKTRFCADNYLIYWPDNPDPDSASSRDWFDTPFGAVREMAIAWTANLEATGVPGPIGKDVVFAD